MTEQALFRYLLVGWLALAAVTYVALFFVAAPYGRHARKGWGPAVGNKLGWVLMEVPAALTIAVCFVLGRHKNVTAWAFLALWEAHYIHRAFVYPLTLRGAARRMPLSVVGMGAFFNGVNGYLNGRYLFDLSGGYPATWLRDPRFLVGLVVFLSGYVINRHADLTLRRLRAGDESGYRIPYGGLYRWISCPNYFGEIGEWIGWAIATWSVAGLSFAIWTIANLAPRAWFHHRWYREHFPDYPPERRALIPGLW